MWLRKNEAAPREGAAVFTLQPYSMTISTHFQADAEKTKPRLLGFCQKPFVLDRSLTSKFNHFNLLVTEQKIFSTTRFSGESVLTIKARSADQSNCELLKSALQFRKTEAPSLMTGEGVKVAYATGSSSWGIYQIPPHEEDNKYRLRPANARSRLQGASQRNPANQPPMGKALGKPVASSDDIGPYSGAGQTHAAHRSKRPSFGHGCWTGCCLVQFSAKSKRVAQSHFRLGSDQQARSAYC